MSGSEPLEPPEADRLGKRRGTWKARDDSDLPPEVPGRCNARMTRRGQPARCARWAGAGTDHTGYGNCKRHCGNTETGRKNGAREMYAAELAGRTRFGELIPTDPMLGLLGEVSRTAGAIAYVQRLIEETQDPGTGEPHITEVDLNGVSRPTALYRLWQEERAHLAKVSKMALDAGVAQAQLDLVAAYAERFLDSLEAVLRDCGLDPDAPEVSEAVTRRLALVSAQGVVS